MSVKTIIFAAAAAAVTATAGAADTYFENGKNLEGGDVLELGLITADSAGVLEIYDYHTGQQGKLVGTERLSAGANTDVRVDTGLPQTRDVIAVVKIDGQVVASKQFDIN
jgi:hypothetical protein